jgi:hypothetical protein
MGQADAGEEGRQQDRVRCRVCLVGWAISSDAAGAVGRALPELKSASKALQMQSLGVFDDPKGFILCLSPPCRYDSTSTGSFSILGGRIKQNHQPFVE